MRIVPGVVDQRTDSFVRLGKMYGTKPGHYLLAPKGWDGTVPDHIAGVFRYDTRVAVVTRACSWTTPTRIVRPSSRW